MRGVFSALMLVLMVGCREWPTEPDLPDDLPGGCIECPDSTSVIVADSLSYPIRS